MPGDLFLCLLALCITIFLTCYGHRAPMKVNFIISAFISGYFFYCQISPYFDPKMKLFGGLLATVVLMGALVGGVVGVLLPKITTGISLGFLVSLFASVIIYGTNAAGNLSLILIPSAFASLITGSILLSQKYVIFCSSIRTALVTGLAVSMSVDVMLHKGLIGAMKAVLNMIFFGLEEPKCFKSCQVPLLLCFWLIWASLFWLTQNSLSGQMKKWMNRELASYNYQPLNANRGCTEGKFSAQQRTFSYPDTLEFNFFDPDKIPEILQPYATVVFDTVQSIAKQYGFQVDNSRNQAEHLLMMLTNESAPTDSNLSAAANRLHTKTFANYQKWCDRMGTPPLYSRPNNKVTAIIFNHYIQ